MTNDSVSQLALFSSLYLQLNEILCLTDYVVQQIHALPSERHDTINIIYLYFL
ncbi:hypothetical protein LC605_20945 [Nostoc sp. CHAB 5836]|uniref:hypothetical protein n=1 Tax=Nostoc sp. CHAB 5836 TaxID=2780404 RepID=UPI001E3C4937|nr:hypothetical protein [Nostoc sp. CHAB 5836]MCC5617507.1 hypothetical protein [Nostoc sp. CHAB 5836]